MQELNNKYQTWLVNWFSKREAPEKLSLKSNFFREGAIDSFGLIILIEEIEKEFNIKLSQEELEDPRFVSIEGLSNILKEKNEF